MILLAIIMFVVVPICGLYNYYKEKAEEKWREEHPDVILPE